MSCIIKWLQVLCSNCINTSVFHMLLQLLDLDVVYGFSSFMFKLYKHLSVSYVASTSRFIIYHLSV